MALIEGAAILQTHYRAQQFCNASPFPELSQLPPECTLAAGYPSYQQYHGASDHTTTTGAPLLFSPRLSTSKGRLAPRWPWDPSERASTLFPYPRLGVGYPSCPDGWVPSLSGHHSPHSRVTRSHPCLFTQCPDEHLKSVLKGLCTYSLSAPQKLFSRTGAEHSSGIWEPSDLELHREWSLTKAYRIKV